MPIQKLPGESIEEAYVRTYPEQFTNKPTVVSVRFGETVAQSNARSSGATEHEVARLSPSYSGSDKGVLPGAEYKPIILTLPSGAQTTASPAFAAKLAQGQAQEKKDSAALAQNQSYVAQKITEQQYAAKYPVAYEHERRGLGYAATDIKISATEEEAKQAKAEAQQSFKYPQPQNRYEYTEKNPQMYEKGATDIQNQKQTTTWKSPGISGYFDTLLNETAKPVNRFKDYMIAGFEAVDNRTLSQNRSVRTTIGGSPFGSDFFGGKLNKPLITPMNETNNPFSIKSDFYKSVKAGGEGLNEKILKLQGSFDSFKPIGNKTYSQMESINGTEYNVTYTEPKYDTGFWPQVKRGAVGAALSIPSFVITGATNQRAAAKGAAGFVLDIPKGLANPETRYETGTLLAAIPIAKKVWKYTPKIEVVKIEMPKEAATASKASELSKAEPMAAYKGIAITYPTIKTFYGKTSIETRAAPLIGITKSKVIYGMPKAAEIDISGFDLKNSRYPVSTIGEAEILARHDVLKTVFPEVTKHDVTMLRRSLFDVANWERYGAGIEPRKIGAYPRESRTANAQEIGGIISFKDKLHDMDYGSMTSNAMLEKRYKTVSGDFDQQLKEKANVLKEPTKAEAQKMTFSERFAKFKEAPYASLMKSKATVSEPTAAGKSYIQRLADKINAGKKQGDIKVSADVETKLQIKKQGVKDKLLEAHEYGEEAPEKIMGIQYARKGVKIEGRAAMSLPESTLRYRGSTSSIGIVEGRIRAFPEAKRMKDIAKSIKHMGSEIYSLKKSAPSQTSRIHNLELNRARYISRYVPEGVGLKGFNKMALSDSNMATPSISLASRSARVSVPELKSVPIQASANIERVKESKPLESKSVSNPFKSLSIGSFASDSKSSSASKSISSSLLSSSASSPSRSSSSLSSSPSSSSSSSPSSPSSPSSSPSKSSSSSRSSSSSSSSSSSRSSSSSSSKGSPSSSSFFYPSSKSSGGYGRITSRVASKKKRYKVTFFNQYTKSWVDMLKKESPFESAAQAQRYGGIVSLKKKKFTSFMISEAQEGNNFLKRPDKVPLWSTISKRFKERETLSNQPELQRGRIFRENPPKGRGNKFFR